MLDGKDAAFCSLCQGSAEDQKGHAPGSCSRATLPMDPNLQAPGFARSDAGRPFTAGLRFGPKTLDPKRADQPPGDLPSQALQAGVFASGAILPIMSAEELLIDGNDFRDPGDFDRGERASARGIARRADLTGGRLREDQKKEQQNAHIAGFIPRRALAMRAGSRMRARTLSW